MKTALVHEWLTPYATGGAELVVKEILNIISADLYALIDFESTNPNSYLYKRKIGTTFLQHLPSSARHIQQYLPFFPLAIEQLDLTGYDVIISSSHAVAKGVITTPYQVHICYCHSPMRYAWDLTFDYLRDSGKGFKSFVARYILHQLRQWDVISSHRVDYFIANSHHIAKRIGRCYGREATVIYPPVAVDDFPLQVEKEDFYITVCRLVSYKKVSLLVEAFNELGKPLLIIGDGGEYNSLKSMAKSNITFLGRVDFATMKYYLAKARCFVYGALEDFGIAIVEAQACGTPVIAYAVGGAGETVLDIREYPKNGTGVLFKEQNKESLMEAVKIFEEKKSLFNPYQCRLNAEKYSVKVFQEQFSQFYQSVLR
ncbi:MAG: glycosyltransferase [Cyanobacterium sp. T60_A2020_053]|nr:glycosyltransferase [Cyanobacterium sp. T60_A2020_053]